MIELPARIGKYELQEYLGGGMSRVYRARDTVIGRTVVVKILTEQACRDAEAKARFLQEARVAGNITHDHIITVYDFGEEGGKPFMVMEFLRGDDLRTLIKTGRTGDLLSKLNIALQIAKALAHIHSLKIIHRDIKPENIHVTAGGVAKLMDFGIAKAENTQLTRPGFTLGTPYYMAPEQIRGEPATPLVDVYAWGIMLFELITGERPNKGDTIERIFYEILHQPVDLTPLKTAGAPEPVADLVARCTAKNAAERPQGFTAVIAELERMVRRIERTVGADTQTPATKTPPAVPAPRTPAAAPPAPAPAWLSSPKILIGISAAGFLMLLGAAYLYLQPKAGTSGTRRPLPAVIQNETGEMVLVPGGPFLSGPDRKQITVPAFYIDRTEVTNAAYDKFCKATNRRLPDGFSKDHPDYPVVNISYFHAQEFAKWAAKRLPRPEEWEKAARGTDGRPFPWGNERDPRRANVQDNPDRVTLGLMPVDSLASGSAPGHVLNMVGNAYEFVEGTRGPTPAALSYFRKAIQATTDELWCSLRGGSYHTPLSDPLVYDASVVPARYHNYDIGFRCARNAP